MEERKRGGNAGREGGREGWVVLVSAFGADEEEVVGVANLDVLV
jgi:hypothetical protein